jgi:hypothetical protein
MNTAATMEIGSDLWNARMYAGLSQASELAAELSRPRDRLFFQWKMYRGLGHMNRGLDEIFDKWDRLAIRHAPSTYSRLFAPEEYCTFRDNVMRLHAVHVRILSPQDGFPRNAFMRKRLARFEAHSERLLDLADWLDAMSTPEEMNARFSSLEEDLAKGDVVPWAAVK